MITILNNVLHRESYDTFVSKMKEHTLTLKKKKKRVQLLLKIHTSSSWPKGIILLPFERSRKVPWKSNEGWKVEKRVNGAKMRK